jgi:surface polysaccharide O-acyltransferase-like enzyme
VKTTNSSFANRSFYPGLEYLRVILIILVVGWHSKLLGEATFSLYPLKINIADYLYLSVFLLGVPTFFIISQFLYARNRRKGYLVKRVLTLAVFLLFWNLVAFSLFADQSSVSKWFSLNFIVKGYGPLYFILDLIILTSICEFIYFCYKKIKSEKFIFMIYLILVITLTFTLITPFIIRPGHFINNYLLSFQNFINFLPYTIVAFLISEKIERIEKDKASNPKFKTQNYVILFIIGAFFALIEYFAYNKLLSLQYIKAFPIYNRISLFIITIALFYLFLGLKQPVNKFVGQLASLTGGVFIIHFIILETTRIRFPDLYAYNLHYPYLIFIAVLTLSFVISWVLKMRRII